MEEANITRALRILEASVAGVLEWDFQQKVLLLCPSFLSIINEPSGHHAFDLTFFWGRLHRQDRALILSSVRSQLETSAPIDIEFRLKEHRGTYLWVRAQGQTTRDAMGNPCILTVVLTNISEQHHIAAKLTLSEEKLRHATECANISLWEMIEDYSEQKFKQHIWCSDSFYSMLGYDKQELSVNLENIYKLMHPADINRVKEEVRKMIENYSQEIDFQFRLMHKTQGYLWLRCTGHREQSGKALFKSTGATIDINDLKLAQQEAKIKNEKLEQTNEELEHFAYAASHDLKAPLRGLKNLSNWIREDIESPTEAIKKNLRLMNNRVERMENLLEDILAYSRAGRRNKEPEEIDLNSLIAEIWDCARPPAGFQLHLRLEQPSITASRTLLEQTFSNLISNAIKHHDRADGEICISYDISDAQYHFSVTDDGPGIDPKFQHKIFQIFQTLRPRDEVEGSGVGLAIVKRNIVSSGGTVWLDSLQEQSGARFNFTLPRQEGRMPSERESLGLFDNAP